MKYGLMWKTVPTVLAKVVVREDLTNCVSIASIAWQEGESVLAGLPLFRRVVALEAESARLWS